MPEHCPECGAPLPEGGTCRDQFHALLAQESAILGGPGVVPHCHAVADVLTVELNAAAYADRVRRWARSVCETLTAEGQRDPRPDLPHSGGCG